MTDGQDDKRLGELFLALRERDHARTPSFERVRVGARRHPLYRIPWGRRLLGAVVAGAAALVLMVHGARRIHPRPAPIELKAGEWRSATDFLLEMASAGAMEAIPRIGDTTTWYPASATRWIDPDRPRRGNNQ